MTDAEWKAQLQVAQDMLDCAVNQRVARDNECIQLTANVKALERAAAEKDKRIAELEAKVKDLSPAESDAPVANGHDGEAAHAAH